MTSGLPLALGHLGDNLISIWNPLSDRVKGYSIIKHRNMVSRKYCRYPCIWCFHNGRYDVYIYISITATVWSFASTLSQIAAKFMGSTWGPTWVLSAPGWPRVGPMKPAIRELLLIMVLRKYQPCNYVRATAFILDSRTDVLEKVSKILRQKCLDPEGTWNLRHFLRNIRSWVQPWKH